MVKYKCGAIVKDVSKGAEKWYKLAGWKKLENKKPEDKDMKNDKTDSKKTITS